MDLLPILALSGALNIWLWFQNRKLIRANRSITATYAEAGEAHREQIRIAAHVIRSKDWESKYARRILKLDEAYVDLKKLAKRFVEGKVSLEEVQEEIIHTAKLMTKDEEK